MGEGGDEDNVDEESEESEEEVDGEPREQWATRETGAAAGALAELAVLERLRAMERDRDVVEKGGLRRRCGEGCGGRQAPCGVEEEPREATSAAAGRVLSSSGGTGAVPDKRLRQCETARGAAWGGEGNG